MKKRFLAVLLVLCVTLSPTYLNNIPVVLAAEIVGENYGGGETVTTTSEDYHAVCETIGYADDNIVNKSYIETDNEFIVSYMAEAYTDLETFEVSGVIFGILDDTTVSLVDGKSVVGDYEIPSEVSYNGNSYKVVSISGGAFSENENLTGIVMPDTITVIEDRDWYPYYGAFGKCTLLSSVTFSQNLTYIGKFAFRECSNLVSVTLPDKLEGIADEAFSSCSGITALQIPDSVTYIGQCALSETSLKTFTIPATCTRFHDWAVDNIETLESVNVGAGHPRFKSVNGIVYTKDMSWIVIYPQGKKDQIFEIPEGVTTIRSGAFFGVKNLVKVIFPTTCSVNSLGTAAFQRSGIQEFGVAEGNPYLCAIDGVLFTADRKTLLAYPAGNTQKVYFIPSGTENIGKSGLYVFDHCLYIEEVYIPSSVKTFDSIMWYCENLKKVVYAKDSKISTVESSCFQGTGLESICLPASIDTFSSAGNNFFDSVGNEFAFCYNLKTMYIAKGAELYNCGYFGSQTLSSCVSLTIYGEGMDNAVSALADKFYRPYIDVSSGCDRVLGITFDDTCVSVEEGECVQQKAFIYPESAENKTVTYESSDPSVATVDENGNISGIASGICYITATAADESGEYARCKVTVRNNYTVTFKNESEESKVLVAEGEKVEEPTVPEREGYRFDGWFAEGVAKAFDFETAINGDITLTAKWTKLTHKLEAVGSKVPTCLEDGNIYYFKCTDCGKLYRDVAGEEELSEEDVAVPAKGHELEKVEAKEATCTENGNAVHYKCKSCGKLYLDAAGKEELTEEEVAILAKGHELEKVEAKEATCTENGNASHYKCVLCGKLYLDAVGEELSEEEALIPTKDHIFGKWEITVQPDYGKEGTEQRVCSLCGKSETRKVPELEEKLEIGSVTLSQTSYTYNGKVQKPTVTVKDSKGKVLKIKTDYTISFPKGMKNVGRYTVTVTLKGNYKGTIDKTFDIVPKGTSISKVTAKKKGFVAKWKKQVSQTTGYEIAYSTSSKFSKKNTKTVTVKSSKTTSKAVSKLKAKKKYYVRIRTYKKVKVNGKSTNLYSAWSKVEAVTAK